MHLIIFCFAQKVFSSGCTINQIGYVFMFRYSNRLFLNLMYTFTVNIIFDNAFPCTYITCWKNKITCQPDILYFYLRVSVETVTVKYSFARWLLSWSRSKQVLSTLMDQISTGFQSVNYHTKMKHFRLTG